MVLFFFFSLSVIAYIMVVDLDLDMKKGGELENTNRIHVAFWVIIIYYKVMYVTD